MSTLAGCLTEMKSDRARQGRPVMSEIRLTSSDLPAPMSIRLATVALLNWSSETREMFQLAGILDLSGRASSSPLLSVPTRLMFWT